MSIILSDHDEELAHEVAGGIDAETAAAIGYVVIYWSFLEHTLFSVLAELSGLELGISGIFFSEVSFLQRVSMLTSIMHYSRNAAWYTEWLEIEKHIIKLKNSRNDMAHGLWRVENKSALLVRIKSRRKVSITNTPKTCNEIKDLWKDILEAVYKIQNFREKLARENFQNIIKCPPGPPLDHVYDQKVAHAQVRAQKKANNQSRQGPKMSSAQKRTKLTAEKQSP